MTSDDKATIRVRPKQKPGPRSRIDPADLFEAMIELSGTNEVADYFGVVRQTIWSRLKSKEYRDFIDEAVGTLADRFAGQLESDLRKALNAAVRALDHKDTRVQLEAARLVFDLHARLRSSFARSNADDSVQPDRTEMIASIRERAKALPKPASAPAVH